MLEAWYKDRPEVKQWQQEVRCVLCCDVIYIL